MVDKNQHFSNYYDFEQTKSSNEKSSHSSQGWQYFFKTNFGQKMAYFLGAPRPIIQAVAVQSETDLSFRLSKCPVSMLKNVKNNYNFDVLFIFTFCMV